MNTVCEKNKCTGCMACVEVCSKKAIRIEDTLDAYNAAINEEMCVHCHACTRVCQKVTKDTMFREPILWYQGWSIDGDNRKNSSSGAAAYELARAAINRGGSVFSCLFSCGEFRFDEAGTEAGFKKFIGSKYVKSNPLGVYHRVGERLKADKLVLFIGLPCQAAALKRMVGEDDNLFTVDLICHGTPSPKLLEVFLKQYGCGLESLKDIRFRGKNLFQDTSGDETFAPRGVRDPYMTAFLNGLIHTESCYDCNYARRERVSDITIGDSWGSEAPSAEQNKGISLILAQTNKGMDLINDTAMQLNPVNLDKAIAANHQLQHPSVIPAGREEFFKGLKEGKRFNTLVKHTYPKQYIRQAVKGVFVKLGFLKDGAEVNDYRVFVRRLSSKNNSNFEVSKNDQGISCANDI